jgi:hypothetical protein
MSKCGNAFESFTLDIWCTPMHLKYLKKPDLYECRCVKVWMDFFTTNFLYFSHLHLFTFYQIKAEDINGNSFIVMS